MEVDCVWKYICTSMLSFHGPRYRTSLEPTFSVFFISCSELDVVVCLHKEFLSVNLFSVYLVKLIKSVKGKVCLVSDYAEQVIECGIFEGFGFSCVIFNVEMLPVSACNSMRTEINNVCGLPSALSWTKCQQVPVLAWPSVCVCVRLHMWDTGRNIECECVCAWTVVGHCWHAKEHGFQFLIKCLYLICFVVQR